MFKKKMGNVVYPYTKKQQLLKLQAFVLALTLGCIHNASAMDNMGNDAEQNNPILLDRMLMNQQDIAYQESVFQDTVKTLVKLQATYNEQKSIGILKNLIVLNNQIW